MLTISAGQTLTMTLGRGKVTTMMGKKMSLRYGEYDHTPWTRGITYLNSKKAVPTMIERSRIVQCSAFMNTLTKQYMKAAIHRNHSNTAASITKPTIAV
jgi:hypothetical protein